MAIAVTGFFTVASDLIGCTLSAALFSAIWNPVYFLTLYKEPPSGTNKVIVDHSFPQGVGLDEIPNLGTVVVKPRGHGNGYEIVDQISLAELLSLR